ARLPPIPPPPPRPGSLAPNIGDHGPSDSALAAASAWRLRRPGADRHAARCASRDLCSGARPSAPCALVGGILQMIEPCAGSLIKLSLTPLTPKASVPQFGSFSPFPRICRFTVWTPHRLPLPDANVYILLF